MKIEKDYKKDYEEFWKEIVEVDGKPDLDKVKRELSDYHFLMQQVPQVYMEVSGGMISKQNTYASEVLGEFNERFLDKSITQDDLKDALKNCKTLEELKEELTDYFQLD